MDSNHFSWSVNRIKSLFVDNTGHPKSVAGTGFWINVDNYAREYGFITNKHTVDPVLKCGESFRTVKIELELRELTQITASSTRVELTTRFFEIDLEASGIYCSEDADAALIYPAILKNPERDFKPMSGFRIDDLADEHFYDHHLEMTDLCHFVGFAQSRDRRFGWWDAKHQSPIARLASIASDPKSFMRFTHSGIKTSDVILVSGLSFSGSSGSPVILGQKGIGTDFPPMWPKSKYIVSREEWDKHEDLGKPSDYYFMDKKFISSRLLGIMTGHYDDEFQQTLEHSGLSYFTCSTSILPLFERAGFTRESGFWERAQVMRSL